MLKILQWKIKDFCRSGVKIVLNFSDFDWRNIARYRPGCQLELILTHCEQRSSWEGYVGLYWEGYMRCFAPVVYLHQQGIWEVWCAIGKGGYHPLKIIRPLLALAQTSGIDSLDPPISKLWSPDIHQFPHAPGGILRILLRRKCFAPLYGIVGHRGDLSEFISGPSLLKRPLLLDQPI